MSTLCLPGMTQPCLFNACLDALPKIDCEPLRLLNYSSDGYCADSYMCGTV
jgi:hypothetical protein